MSINVTVLGGSGMLGAMLVDYLSRELGFAVTATVRNKNLAPDFAKRTPNVNWRLFDVEEDGDDALAGIVEGNAWVINAIGVTKPFIHDDDPAEVERALELNARFPYRLARTAEHFGAQVIQIATDCVYSGDKGRYRESDKHDALDVYGKTKSLGEVHSPAVFHLRCSIIGPELKSHASLLDWFLKQSQGAKLNGFLNHRWNGITTLHFAKLCFGILRDKIELPHLQHIVPQSEVTKCALLQCFAHSFGREDITINPVNADTVVDRTLATANESLNHELWAAAGYSKPPSVSDMVAELAGYSFQLAEVKL